MPTEQVRKVVQLSSNTQVLQRDSDNNFSKTCIWVEKPNFYGKLLPRKKPDTYLIIGFDTEYKPAKEQFTREEIAAGEATYEVLSYQIFCSVHDVFQPDATRWGGICYPPPGKRLSFGDILTFAFWKGISTGSIKTIPPLIYLAGHFTRADMPALDDFDELTDDLDAVRSTFVSIKDSIPVAYTWDDGSVTQLDIDVRDTKLLSPASSQSLKAIGEIVGTEKLALDPDAAKEQYYKSNMDVLLREDPELFERYAINDAEICTRYIEQLAATYKETTGKDGVPPTLTSIGVTLLLNKWRAMKISKDAVLGQEVITSKYFDKQLWRYRRTRTVVPIHGVDLYTPLASESYHGGRGEQFWFGPAFEDDWTDYDLSSAYPTAMALIGYPDWRAIKATTKVDRFTPTTLGMADVSFEFPASVRFPTMPVRSDNGLVFPRKGRTNCPAPEIALARSLGARIKIHHGVVVPTDSEKRVFGDFIRDCIAKRAEHKKGSLQALFWKEISNSSYGKTAQGLREKRVYDLRDKTTRQLDQSKITNAYFAAFITSFVRAALGEVINALPPSVCVFSCTTDGFLTNATQAQIDAAATGPISDLYRDARKLLTGERSMLEIKHRVRKPLGWRTRGQATLEPGADTNDGVASVVLAKGGIFIERSLDTTEVQNRFVVDLFLNREPGQLIQMYGLTGIRDIIERNADVVGKQWTKKLSMEFDWKRRPVAAWTDPATGHIAFATKPWDTIAEFNAMRKYWEAFAIQSPRVLKTTDDFREFAVYVMSQSSVEEDFAKWMRRVDPDINRLRQSLCAAWRQSKAGIDKKAVAKSAEKFAALLTSVGIPCKRTDVENARKEFVWNVVPPTPNVKAALKLLRKQIPSLQTGQLLAGKSGIDIIGALEKPMPFARQSVTHHQLENAA